MNSFFRNQFARTLVGRLRGSRSNAGLIAPPAMSPTANEMWTSPCPSSDDERLLARQLADAVGERMMLESQLTGVNLRVNELRKRLRNLRQPPE